MTIAPDASVGESSFSESQLPKSMAGEMEEAREYVRMLNRFPRHKQICVCGHTINSHHYSAATKSFSCEPANFICACKAEESVYCASDARWFKRSTHGVGKKHALFLGIASLEEKGGTGEWLVPAQCQVQGCRGLEISIACVDSQGRVMPFSTDRSAFLCKEHILSFGGIFR